MEETKQYITKMFAKITKESKEQILASMGGKPIEPAEMHSWLRLKADKDYADNLASIKADKTEVSITNSMIEIMHNQMNHICLVL